MFTNKIVRWMPLITIAICLMLVATGVSAQPSGGPWEGRGQGPGMGRGMGMGQQGPGMQGPHGQGMGPGPMAGHDIMGHLIGVGGPFADPKVEKLMAEIKILGFINRFEFTEDQLSKIAGLSKDARSTAERMVDEVRDMMIPRLQEARDALMKGEKPERKGQEGKPEISDEMKDLGKDTKEALEGIVDKFFELLTEDQQAMLKGRGGMGQGAGPMGPGQFQPGPGQWQGQRRGQGNRPGFRSEDDTEGSELPEAIDVPPIGEDEELGQGRFRDKRNQGYGGGLRPGMGQGPGQGQPFGPPGGDNKMMIKMRVLEILLDPRTADVINERLRNM